MCIWIYLRHYLNLRIIYSLFTEFKTIGPYVMDWEAGQFKCPLSFGITLSLLGSLQALNLFWLFFILRIAYRFAVHNVAQDDRSDVEESETEDNGTAAESKAEKKNGEGKLDPSDAYIELPGNLRKSRKVHIDRQRRKGRQRSQQKDQTQTAGRLHAG